MTVFYNQIMEELHRQKTELEERILQADEIQLELLHSQLKNIMYVIELTEMNHFNRGTEVQ